MNTVDLRNDGYSNEVGCQTRVDNFFKRNSQARIRDSYLELIRDEQWLISEQGRITTKVFIRMLDEFSSIVIQIKGLNERVESQNVKDLNQKVDKVLDDFNAILKREQLKSIRSDWVKVQDKIEIFSQQKPTAIGSDEKLYFGYCSAQDRFQNIVRLFDDLGTCRLVCRETPEWYTVLSGLWLTAGHLLVELFKYLNTFDLDMDSEFFGITYSIKQRCWCLGFELEDQVRSLGFSLGLKGRNEGYGIEG